MDRFLNIMLRFLHSHELSNFNVDLHDVYNIVYGNSRRSLGKKLKLILGLQSHPDSAKALISRKKIVS